jgi:purine-binding chemotaxis protein CheW
MKTATQNQIESSSQATSGKYLTFLLGQESYGVEVLKVREIIRLQAITNVPRMPEYVKGVINLRGKIIPVIDLRIKFSLDKAEDTERTCIVVVHVCLSTGNSLQMGLIVDEVDEVLNILPGDLEETPDFGTKLDTEYILGMAKVKGTVKTLLDIDKVVGQEGEIQKLVLPAATK